MTSQYRHRRTSTPATPFPTLEPGEIAVNTANRQISVGDAATPTLGTPKPLLAIRFFDSAAIYAIGDIVTNADKIWRAIAANGPGSFNAANWELAASQVTIAADPPSNAVAGSMWWDSDNGMLYVRYNDGDSSQWVQATAMPVVDTSSFVLKAGDTMSGDLTITKSTPLVVLNDTGGVVGDVRFNRNGGRRWIMRMNGTPEIGGNGGSDFQLLSYQDDGTNLAAVHLTGYRADGRLSVYADPVAPLGVATKQYVDARAGDAMAYSGMQINGGMEVSQERGIGGLAVTNSSATIADVFRFAISGTGTVGVQQQTVAPPGFTNSVLLNCTTISTLAGANDYQWFEHRIEGYRWSRLGWGAAGAQPVTIGFWIQPPISGTMAVAVQTQVSPYRTYVVDVPVTAAAWQYKTVTIPGDVAGTWPKDNTVGAIVYFVFGVGSSRKTTANTWATQGTAVGTAATTNFFAAGGFTYITGVTVLPGTQAPTAAQSPLLMRPYDQELATCQRYYQKMDVPIIYQGYAAGAGAVVYGTMPYKVPMRSGPTITFPGATYFNASALAVYGGPQLTHFAFQYTISAAGAGFFNSGFIMDARL